jgi:cobalt-zinc-cadmium efflux system outer membrane protein
MNVTIKLLMCAMMLLVCKHTHAQTDTIHLSTAQAEDLFIRQNLELIAERLEIDIAEAAIIQARVWENPTIFLEDVNLWRTDDFRDEMGDIFPGVSPVPGRQFSVGIEQIIITGGKRRRLIAVEEVSRDIATLYFEELVRSLKAELRNVCTEILFLQDYRNVLERQRTSLEALINNYRSQVERGNVSRSELMRLQAELLGVRSEINELQREMNEQQKELSILLNITTPTHIVLTAADVPMVSPNELSFGRLLELAEASRPDLRETRAQTQFFERSLRYEQAQRIPDLALSASYDRAGGVGPNFVGFGISMDLPVFDRNQGNIRAAQIGIQQSKTLVEQKQLEVRSEIIHAMQNFRLAYEFNREITDEFITDLEEMLEAYIRNFANRNIGIVEFLDFFEAWKDNKETMLEARRDVRLSFEELRYAIGTDL